MKLNGIVFILCSLFLSFNIFSGEANINQRTQLCQLTQKLEECAKQAEAFVGTIIENEDTFIEIVDQIFPQQDSIWHDSLPDFSARFENRIFKTIAAQFDLLSLNAQYDEVWERVLEVAEKCAAQRQKTKNFNAVVVLLQNRPQKPVPHIKTDYYRPIPGGIGVRFKGTNQELKHKIERGVCAKKYLLLAEDLENCTHEAVDLSTVPITQSFTSKGAVEHAQLNAAFTNLLHKISDGTIVTLKLDARFLVHNDYNQLKTALTLPTSKVEKLVLTNGLLAPHGLGPHQPIWNVHAARSFALSRAIKNKKIIIKKKFSHQEIN